MLGGGNFTYYNKIMPGTYTRWETVRAQRETDLTGFVAGGFVMDWGPEGEPFQIEADQWESMAEQITGYSSVNEKNVLFRECFKHGETLIGYRLNSGSVKAFHEAVGEAKYSGSAGNDITVSVVRNAHNDRKVDVTTYYKGRIVDVQTTPIVAQTTKDLTMGVLKDVNLADVSEDLDGIGFDITCEGDTVTAKLTTEMPEGYKLRARVVVDGNALDPTPGLFDLTVTEDTVTLTFGPDAEVGVNYRLKLKAMEKETKERTTLKIQEVSYVLNENGVVGADVSKLSDNPYVVFRKDAPIEENAGYVFGGGKTFRDVTVEDHVKLINSIDMHFFNTLFCDSDDEAVKQLYVEYTLREREERGKYFQVVVHDYVEADHEAVISVKNCVYNRTEGVNETSLVCWTAGYSSSITLNSELTNKVYDGELTIDVAMPNPQLEILVQQGHFLYHRTALDRINVLIDYNTLQTYTEKRLEFCKNNNVIRTVDYIHNAEADVINRLDIGVLRNTPEGRSVIWSQCVDILQSLADRGILENFNPAADVEVLPVTDPNVDDYKYKVIINQRVWITGMIRQVYITTYVME